MAFTGDCANLNVIGCNDDDGIGAFSKLTLTGLTPGETVMQGFGSTAMMSMELSKWLRGAPLWPLPISRIDVQSPNPVREVLEISARQNITNVEVYNLVGQQVIAVPVNSNSKS
jgi:hypothetical protein